MKDTCRRLPIDGATQMKLALAAFTSTQTVRRWLRDRAATPVMHERLSKAARELGLEHIIPELRQEGPRP